MIDAIAETTEAVQGVFSGLRIELQNNQDTELNRVMKQYVKRFKLDENAVSAKVDNDIHFKSLKQASAFAASYPDRSVIQNTEQKILTLDMNRLDLNLRASRMISHIAQALLDPGVVASANSTPEGQHHPTIPLTSNQEEIVCLANGSTTQFLYDQFIRDAQSPLRGYEEAGEWYSNILKPMLRTLKPHGSNKFITDHGFYQRFEHHVRTELSAMARLCERMKQDPTVSDFQLKIPQGDEDRCEATDIFALVTYQDGKQEEIRYQTKHHAIKQIPGKGNCIRVVNKHVPLSPNVAHSFEMIIDPSYPHDFAIYDLQTFKPDTSIGSISEFTRDYLIPTGNKTTYDRIASATQRDQKNHIDHFTQEKIESVTHKTGWIVLITQI